MKNALFIIQNDAETRGSDYATLSALAASLKDAGYASELLVVDRVATGAITVAGGSVFARTTAFRPASKVGDGADSTLRLLKSQDAFQKADLIITPASIASRNWAPQIAASLAADYIMTCERIVVDGASLVAQAPVMGGMITKTTAISDRKAILVYSGDALQTSLADTDVTPTDIDVPASGVRFVSSEALPDSGGIPLRGAAKVVSGGLGVGSSDKWKIIEEFAAKVDAAVGASRAAVEMGWAPSSRQVGFSGQKVSPDVYVAVGISGAVHHLAGIGGAKKIVAINTDADASIFKMADVAIVGDYEKILGAAISKLG